MLFEIHFKLCILLDSGGNASRKLKTSICSLQIGLLTICFENCCFWLSFVGRMLFWERLLWIYPGCFLETLFWVNCKSRSCSCRSPQPHLLHCFKLQNKSSPHPHQPTSTHIHSHQPSFLHFNSLHFTLFISEFSLGNSTQAKVRFQTDHNFINNVRLLYLYFQNTKSNWCNWSGWLKSNYNLFSFHQEQ